MNASRFVGRVGGLAVALGVGAVIWSAQSAASADAGPDPDRASAGTDTAAHAAESPRRTTAAKPSGIHSRPARTPRDVETARAPGPSPAMTAKARRELSPRPAPLARAGSTPTQSAQQSSAISVAPVLAQVTDEIINGAVTAVDSRGYGLIYTVETAPNMGGKITLNGDTGDFSYLPDYAVLSAGGSEQFDIRISEKTPIVALLDGLVDIAEVRTAVRSLLTGLHQNPILNFLLTPLIGYSTVARVDINNGLLVPSPLDTPVAYTTKVISSDGTPISTNYFPAPGLQVGQTAPTIFTTAGLSAPGQEDPYGLWDPSIVFVHLVPGIEPLREAGYNVVTWDSRGKGASGGTLQLGAPGFEGQDANALISYYAEKGRTSADSSGDPLIGMVGGSYGGGMQLVDAAIDSRIDAIVPGIAWNTLTNSLYPDKTFNTLWGALLPVLLLSAGARVNPEIYLASLTGVLFNWVSPSAQTLLARTGPGELVSDITAATLLIQGIPDTTFPLNEAVTNAELLTTAGTPVKMIWYCGGHGVCLDPPSPIQDDLILDDTLDWLSQHVKGVAAEPIPTFQWVDQFGDFYASDLMPFDPAFNGDPIVTTGRGGILSILSILGGGGLNLSAPPLSLLATSRALNAVNLTIPMPNKVTQVVGSPELTLTYAGIGTTRHVYAQLVDDQTGLVLANAVTPVPVVLDGQQRTVTVSMNSVAQTMQPGTSITLQVTNAGVPFLDALALGVLDISSMELSLPTVGDGVAVPTVGAV